MVLEYLGSGDVPDEVDLVLSPVPDFVSGRSVQTRLKATSGSPPSFMVPAFPNGTAAAVIRVSGGKASTEFQYPIKRK